MHSLAPTYSAIKALKADIVGLFPEYLYVKDSFLNEAIARGLLYSGKRFNTYASLTAFIKGSETFDRILTFDKIGFVTRLMQLTDDPVAEAVGVLMEGAEIEIDVKKLPPDRQNAFRYSDVAYTVSVAVKGIEKEILRTPQLFLLPEFDKNGSEPYRIDSAHPYRTDIAGFSVTRGRTGRQVMTAKLLDGRWQGGLYIYSPKHVDDDSRCLKSVKMSLLRAILPVLTSGVHCFIFRPDRYDYGAWRIQVRLSQKIINLLNSRPLEFNLPMLPHRLLIPDLSSRTGLTTVKFDGDTWYADLYTNGMDEDDNTTTLIRAKAELLSNVHKQLTRLGGFS